jgi:hypothetical protein
MPKAMGREGKQLSDMSSKLQSSRAKRPRWRYVIPRIQDAIGWRSYHVALDALKVVQLLAKWSVELSLTSARPSPLRPPPQSRMLC